MILGLQPNSTVLAASAALLHHRGRWGHPWFRLPPMPRIHTEGGQTTRTWVSFAYWYKNLVQEPGTRTWYKNLVQEPGLALPTGTAVLVPGPQLKHRVVLRDPACHD